MIKKKLVKKKLRRKSRKKQPVDYNALPWLTPLKELGQAAECLKTLAHPHRLRMVQMMLHGRYTVGELATACEIPQPLASDHLRLMRRCGFLEGEKKGRHVFYRVAETHLASLMACVEGRFHPQPADATEPDQDSHPDQAVNSNQPVPLASQPTSTRVKPVVSKTSLPANYPRFVQILPGNYEL